VSKRSESAASPIEGQGVPHPLFSQHHLGARVRCDKVGRFELSPPSLSLLRWLVASAVFASLLPFVRLRTRFERRDLPRLIVVGLMNVVLYGLTLNYAETTISAGLASLLVSLGPVFMVVFSALSLKEKVGRRLLYALLLAVLGSVLLSVSDLNVRGLR
jgi:drug/metabolite transporter (DMT)-like permease